MGRYSEEAGTFKITSATFSPLLSHPFPTDDPLIITDNKTAGNQLGGGLVCCWGSSAGVSAAQSKLLTLSPEHSGSDIQTVGAELLPGRGGIHQDA